MVASEWYRWRTMSGRRQFGSIRRLPSKRYQASYPHGGTRHNAPVTFTSKSDAAAFLSSVETDLRRGTWSDVKSTSIPMAKLAQEWLAANARKRASSVSRDESILR